MELIIKSFDIFPYVVDKHDNIWKYTNKGYFIKITPWNDGEDRRVNRYQIEQLIRKGKLTQYTAKPKIFEKINKHWDNVTWEWDYNKDHFEVSLQGNNGNDFFKAPIHKFPHTYKDKDENEHTYYYEYRIVFFNGNIYWATPYHYWPQVQIYEFISEDKEPKITLNSYSRWVKGSHLRPIYSVNRVKYI